MESLRAYNLKLLANILPMYVAEHFLKTQNSKDEVGTGQLCPANGYISLKLNRFIIVTSIFWVF